MSLRESGKATGQTFDLRAIVESEVMSDVENGYELVAFADALMGKDEEALVRARDYLVRVIGAHGLVEVAAVASNFNQMDRIADSTGIPIDAFARGMMDSLWDELDIRSYGSAPNTLRLVAPKA